jgi:hypothetical protein
MKRKTNLILLGTVFAVVGTVYAFSGYGNAHSCNNLLALGTDCNACEIGGYSNINSAAVLSSLNTTVNFNMGKSVLLEPLEDKDISFFNVPLVCNAAPTIGCGSRAKPVLTSFEKSPNVKEAWLNREGTTVAVVWKNNLNVNTKTETANTVFSEHNLTATEISSDEYSSNYNSFKSHEGWLKGSDVDKLSKEEASVFAQRLIEIVKENKSISSNHLNKIEQKIADEFYDFFLNYKSIQELGNPNAYKTVLKNIVDYGNEIAGKNSMPTIDALWNECANTPSKSCENGESCSSSCKTSG